MVILLYHEAALHTLLEDFGYAFPLTFCIFSTEQDILSYFRKLLSWFTDPPLTLDMPDNDFSRGLLYRKDQPLLVEDGGRLDQARKNAALLESVMINDVVPWKNGRDTQSLPVQAPVTLLSSCASALNCAPEVIVMDFTSGAFDRRSWLDYTDQVGQNRDYLTAFCGYTSIQTNELKNVLKEGLKIARQLDGGKLTEKCLQTFGIYIGIYNLGESFLSYVLFSNAVREIF